MNASPCSCVCFCFLQKSWGVLGWRAPICRCLPAPRVQSSPRATSLLLNAAPPYHPSALATSVPATSPSARADSTPFHLVKPAVSQETAVMSTSVRKVISLMSMLHTALALTIAISQLMCKLFCSIFCLLFVFFFVGFFCRRSHFLLLCELIV